MKSPRFQVLELLLRMSANAYSNLLLDNALNNESFDNRDKKFISILFYGIIERQITLDYIISKYSSNVRQASPAFCTQRGASVVRMIRISFTPMSSSFFAVSSIASQFRRFIFVCTLTRNPAS